MKKNPSRNCGYEYLVPVDAALAIAWDGNQTKAFVVPVHSHSCKSYAWVRHTLGSADGGGREGSSDPEQASRTTPFILLNKRRMIASARP